MNGGRALLSRLRSSEPLRRLTSETALSPSNMVLPLFAEEGLSGSRPIASMPGVERHGVKDAVQISKRAEDASIPAVLVFGVPSTKDESGSGADRRGGIVAETVAAIKSDCRLAVMTDLCLCAYTSHGHCGLVKAGRIDRAATLERYTRIAVSQAEAGADVVAPSGMIDGQVAAIREVLDEAGFERVAILSYAAKFASAFYGPFRDAVASSPAFGDRRTHQLPPGNIREAMREIAADLDEGADAVMVKPALPYLDVISEARRRFDAPLAAFSVSGEYAMVKAVAANGRLDEGSVVLELLTGIRRAGADMVITYHALEAARLLEE